MVCSKMVCLGLSVLAILGKSCWRKSSRKRKYFSKRNVVSLVGFGFSQM